MADEQVVLYERDGRLGLVTLNHPAKLNQLLAQLQTADADPSTSVVILCAEGRSFCVGYGYRRPGSRARGMAP